MARGQPDYGMNPAKAVGASLSDMAELAARLNSIVEYDRRGDAYRVEDFEGTIEKFAKAAGDPRSAAFLDSTTAKSGSQCVKLLTGNVIGDFMEITLYTAPYPLGKWGVKASGMFGCAQSYNLIYHECFDGVYFHDAGIEIDAVARTLSYANNLGGFTVFYAGFSLFAQLHAFHNAKLVVDFEHDLYVRFMLNNLEWDLSAIPVRRTLNATLPHHRARFIVETQAAANVALYLDDYVFTVNEP